MQRLRVAKLALRRVIMHLQLGKERPRVVQLLGHLRRLRCGHHLLIVEERPRRKLVQQLWTRFDLRCTLIEALLGLRDACGVAEAEPFDRQIRGYGLEELCREAGADVGENRARLLEVVEGKLEPLLAARARAEPRQHAAQTIAVVWDGCSYHAGTGSLPRRAALGRRRGQ